LKRILSAETIAEEVIGRLASGPGIRRDFPFRETAFEEDYCLLLDEMHFSAEAVLQCMEAEIADQRIEITIPWKGFDRRTLHPNFLSQFTRHSFQRLVFPRFVLPSIACFDSSVWTLRRKTSESRRSRVFSARTEPYCFGEIFSLGCRVEVTEMKAVSILGRAVYARKNIEIAVKFCLAGEPYSKMVTLSLVIL
jgi:hypothetical protein